MSRHVLALLALVAVLWQGIAGAAVRAAQDVAEDAQHASLHWDEVSHHHHDDGSYHFDDSPASVIHIVMDGSHGNAVVGLPQVAVYALTLPSVAPAYRASTIPFPYSAPLRRPPRSLT